MLVKFRLDGRLGLDFIDPGATVRQVQPLDARERPFVNGEASNHRHTQADTASSLSSCIQRSKYG